MVARTLKLVSGAALALSMMALGTGCGSSDSKALTGSGAGGSSSDAGADAASAVGSSGSGGTTSSGTGGKGGAGATGSGGTTTGNGGATGTGGGSGLGCTTSADCVGTASCIGGACVPFTSCNNSLDCATDQVCDPTSHRCVECAVKADCSGAQECVAGSCVTITPCTSDKQCTPLKQLCDTTLGRCADCLTAADCATGTTCLGGACVVALCTPNVKFCDGNVIKTCDATGQGATQSKACTAGQYCDPKTVACLPQVCAPGTAACNGSVATKCNALGSGYAAGGTDCAASQQACVAGACKTCSGGATASASVRLAEVMVGTPEYVVLENTSGCPVSLNGLTLSFATSYVSGIGSTFALPAQTLAPGEKVFVVDGTVASPSPAATDIGTTSNIDWQATYGGTVLLCNGACSGATVLDALAFQGGTAPPALPSPITFSPVLTTITTANEQTESFHRLAFTGVSPTFKPSDWSVAAASRPGSSGATCPATQPMNGTSCLSALALSCPYGSVTCTCSFTTFSWSCI